MKITFEQKVQATLLLLLFSFIPFKYFISYLKDISMYVESFNNDASVLSNPLQILYALSQYKILLNILFTVLLLISLMLVWASGYFNEKSIRRTGITLNTIYVLLFCITMALFSKGIYEITITRLFRYFSSPKDYFYSLIITLAILGVILFSYVESIWKFRKKSFIRKYLNSINFIFSSIYWYVFYPVWRMSDFNSQKIIMTAAFFYLISLLIAAIEFYRKKPISIFDLRIP